MRKYRSCLAWIPFLVLSLALAGCGGGGGGGDSGPLPPEVTTTAATGITTTSAILNGTVDPNGQTTEAWFEWGTSPTLATFTATTHQMGLTGTTAVPVNESLPTLGIGATYYFRVAAKVTGGTTELKGSILSFSTSNPPPVANAGVDNSVIQGKSAALDGSGSSAPVGSLSYLWEQLSGTTVTLSSTTVAKPTFTAPNVTPPSKDLVFKLTVTDSITSLTASDNVTITVLWGALDDFSTDTLAEYNPADVSEASFPGQSHGPASWSYDAAGQRLAINAGDNAAVLLSQALPGPTDNVVFSFDFYPRATSPDGGGVWVRFKLDDDNRYEMASFDWEVSPGLQAPYFFKRVGGVDTDTVTLTNVDNSNYSSQEPPSKYTVMITITPTAANINWNGSVTTLSFTNTTAINVGTFEIQTNQQDAYYDNIRLINVP